MRRSSFARSATTSQKRRCGSANKASTRIGRRQSCEEDDEHSSRRRARDRCIAGAVRESVQLEVGVEVQQRCFQRHSISRGRAIQCLPTFARVTGSKRCRTHVARRGRSMGATVRSCHAAPMQSRQQASAGATRDEWFATALRSSGAWQADVCFHDCDNATRPGSDCCSGLSPQVVRRPVAWSQPPAASLSKHYAARGSLVLGLAKQHCFCLNANSDLHRLPHHRGDAAVSRARRDEWTSFGAAMGQL